MKCTYFYYNILNVPSVQPNVLQVVCGSLLNEFNDYWKTSQSEVCPSPSLLVDFYHNCLCFASTTGQNAWMNFEICSAAPWLSQRGDQSEQRGRGKRGEGRGGGRKSKDEMSFVVGIFAQVKSRITKYRIIQVTYLLRLRGGQYRAEPTQICPLGNVHILATSHKDVPSYPSCWLHYYGSQRLMEICAHWGLLVILLAPVWN